MGIAGVIVSFLIFGMILLIDADSQCSGNSIQFGCATPQVQGFIQVSMDPTTPLQVPAAIYLHTQYNVPAIALLDGNSSDRTHNITANITTVGGNLHLSSYDFVSIDTVNNSGIMFEGKVRLWLSGIDDPDGNAPICLMLNGTSLGCITKLSSTDTAVLEVWTTASIIVSCLVVGIIAGVIIGIVIYRARFKRSAYERTENDANFDVTENQLVKNN